MRHNIWKTTAAISLAGLLLLAPTALSWAAGWTKSGNSWTYVENNGSIRKGWIQTSDGYYYMDQATGLMSLGWKKIDDKWYYFKENGLMSTG